MTDEIEVKLNEIKDDVSERTAPLVDGVRRLMLAAVGAVAMTRDEMEQFVNRMVDRGEIAERDAKSMISDVMSRRKRDVEVASDEAEARVETRLEQVLNRMNIPSKRDIDELSDKIAQLSSRVEELKKSRNQ
ncbi:MAG: phasin family protein [Herpetosiphonaceae bacterium]|nr:phasin family protein [Herpetosiphonaceae bacterium]